MSMQRYPHQVFEKKWQEAWEKARVFRTSEKPKRPYYCLDMFPYPSAAGLHVGHPEGYTATDIVSRYQRMKGFDVLHPMGWDSFGLPAENYAIKTGIHPKESTAKSIETFRRQIKSLGFSYDWEREINTASLEYMKWTQWFFLLMLKRGLAYRKKAAVNWCESCQTVLANEQVVDGKCERSGDEVAQKELEQWFFRVTAYAEELLNDLESLNYPERLKMLQRNWIGKSEGAEIDFPIVGSGDPLTVFTTRPDTLYGATFLVLAPEHPLVPQLVTANHTPEVELYVEKAKKISVIDRANFEREKTGVFTGAYVLNPANGEKLPIWIADFVLAEYGTGAIFADAHDERDFAFAKKFDIPLRPTLRPLDGSDDADIRNLNLCYSGDGILYNSGEFDGMTSDQARPRITAWLQKRRAGEPKVTYKIRDWLISRQRYWGAPIPIVYCKTCGTVPVPENELPILLPDDVDFKPTGRSPLLDSKEFINTTCPKCDAPAKRETDTMDGFVDNSWYFFRYLSPHDDARAFDSRQTKTWMPIDLYVGGIEHAVGHLIYSRFFTKVLRDEKIIDFGEPFKKIKNQGIILAEDGRKMSKSLGNVINPDEVVAEYGADTVRMYEMFMGPFEDAKPWDTKGIVGVRRFLQKVCDVGATMIREKESSAGVVRSLHKTIKKATDDIHEFRFNTAVSQMMIFVNDVQKGGGIAKHDFETFLKVLSPFAPHLAEELWEQLGNKRFICQQAWPVFDAKIIEDETVELVIQVNGKVRGKMTVAVGTKKDDLLTQARSVENVQKRLDGKKIVKEIVIPNRLISFVVQ